MRWSLCKNWQNSFASLSKMDCLLPCVRVCSQRWALKTEMWYKQARTGPMCSSALCWDILCRLAPDLASNICVIFRHALSHLTENIHFSTVYIHYVNNLDICPCQGFFMVSVFVPCDCSSGQISLFYHVSIMHIISLSKIFICLFLKNDKGNWNSGFVTY